MPEHVPARQITNTPVTPIIGDLLVSSTLQFERRDIPAYGTAFYKMMNVQGATSKYKDHQFSLAVPSDGQADHYTCYFIAPREDQDLYNFEHVKADIGGNKFDAVTRTYVVKRDDYDPASPAMGSAMPNIPVGKFPTYASHILAARSETRLPKELDSLYVADERTYVRKVSITGVGVDPLNGRPISTVSTIYHKDEVVTGSTTAADLFASPTNPFWGIQTNGHSITGKQISEEFYEVVDEKVVGGTPSGGVITMADYFTTEDYYWPAVFAGVRAYTYELKRGGTRTYVEPILDKDAYRGPCRAHVIMGWSATEHSVSTPEIMLPKDIHINTPFYSLSVEPTLHEAGQIEAVTGDDPVFALNAGIAAQWEATNYTDWPTSILASDEQKPYRGGWLRTQVTISAPPA